MESRKTRILKWSLPCAVIATLVFAGWSILPKASDGKFELTPAAKVAHDNLRQLLGAVATYRDEHGGKFPHDERGSDYALYSLRPYLDAQFLACAPVTNANNTPSWDDNDKRARNAGWEYVNISDPWATAPNAIIFTSRPQEFPASVFFADRSGAIHSRTISTSDACKALIGSFITDESLIFVSKAVLEEWERLGPHGAGWETTSTAAGRMIRTTHPAQKITYEIDYANGQPAARRIQCDGHEIQERLLLDHFGRIVKIERFPEDWKDIWATCTAGAAR